MPPLDWTLRIRSKEHELGQSFQIKFFLGDVPDNSHEKHPITFIGRHVSYTSEMQVPLEEDVLNQDNLYLDDVLKRLLSLPVDQLTPAVVLPYLHQNLRWKILCNGYARDNKELSSLDISVSTRIAEQESGNWLYTVYPLYPVYSPFPNQ